MHWFLFLLQWMVIIFVNFVFLHNVNKDVFSSHLGADPYCVIRCGGRKVKTPVHNDTLNPKFNAGGLFYVRNINTSIAIDVSISSVYHYIVVIVCDCNNFKQYE